MFVNSLDSGEIVVPDFFIIGAQKCGTTMLYTYLKEHPEVFLPDLKEPHFFCTDLPGLSRVSDWRGYCELFRNASTDSLVGDASASYLVSRKAVAEILAINPDAKFIVMIRNPIEMMQSYHSELYYNLSEDVRDFAAAWRLQSLRKLGYNIPLTCNEPRKLQYEVVGSLGDQLERFFSYVPEKNRLVIVHDDVKNDLQSVYRNVLQFLGVREVFPESFEVVNEQKKIKYRTLAIMHRALPQKLGIFYGPLKSVVNSIGISPSRWMERANIEKGSREQLPEEFILELEETFRPQVEKLEALLQRDLSDWLRRRDRR